MPIEIPPIVTDEGVIFFVTKKTDVLDVLFMTDRDDTTRLVLAGTFRMMQLIDNELWVTLWGPPGSWPVVRLDARNGRMLARGTP